MAKTRKTEYLIKEPLVFDRGEEVRTLVAAQTGFDVVFEHQSSKEFGSSVPDPRVTTLQQCIESNTFINPREVQSILNMTDPADIDEMVGSLSTKTFDSLKDLMKDTWDFEKNIPIVKP